MKRVITSTVATVAALVALLSFKTHTPEPATALAATTETTTSPDSTTTSVVDSTSESTTTTAKASSSSKTITGSSVNTRWGPVQVKITVKGTKITAVDVVEYPQNNNRDVEINNYAVPELVSQALSAQSANVDGVSGATYTTNGFEQSLQSAISKI